MRKLSNKEKQIIGVAEVVRVTVRNMASKYPMAEAGKLDRIARKATIAAAKAIPGGTEKVIDAIEESLTAQFRQFEPMAYWDREVGVSLDY